MKKIFMILKDDSYEEYAEYIRQKGILVYTYKIFEKAIEEIPRYNPGAIVSINHFSLKSYDQAEELLNKVREVTECKIFLLSGVKPPAKLIQKADELRNIVVKWGKEIDIDIESIPETEDTEVKTLHEERQDSEVYSKESDPEDSPEDSDLKDEGTEVEDEQIPEETITPDEEINPYEVQYIPEGKINVIVLMEKDLEEDLKEKSASRFIIETAGCIDEVLSKIGNTAAVIFSSSICVKYFEDVKRAAKKIPKIVRLYAIDNASGINQLIYGELETNGIKFFKDFESIIDDIVETPEDLLDEEDKEPDKPGQKIIKNFSGTLNGLIQTTKKIPKPVLTLPKLSKPRERKEPVKKEPDGVKKNKRIPAAAFIERKKIMLFMSPLTTGKTEIASNVALSLSLKGIKTALIDLDLEQKEVLYNFPLYEKEDIYKYRLLSLSLSEQQQLSEDPLELSYRANKNLFVYTTHRDVEIPFTVKSIDLFIRYLKRAVDVIVIDVGRSLSKDMTERLLDVESLEKYLVATQDIGVLNTLPYTLKWFGSFPAYYRDWNLIINNYRPLKGLKDSEIIKYFYDAEVPDLKFEILSTFYIPQSSVIWERKTERCCAYGSDKNFDAAVDEIAQSWLYGKTPKGGQINV